MSEDSVTRLNAALEGRYTIERELGEGGMATVYLANDIKHERKVALKVLKPELAAVVGAERFLAEIKTTANLQHPHILPLFDSGEADTFLFYVMPYVDGEALGDRLAREHQLPVGTAVEIAKNVAEALDYAHSHGVIHRDIKPDNILLQAGKPVISDFGIALAIGVAGGGRLTETGLSLGTPHYMSPEQATGETHVGPSTDIYALGCVLYEMLIGEPPYTGSSAQAVLGKIITAEPVPTREQRKAVPPNVDAVIRRSLEKLSADRFASAGELAQALADEHFRHGEAEATVGVGAHPGQWKRIAVATTATSVLLAGTWIVSAVSAPEPPPPEPIARFERPFGVDQQPPYSGPGGFAMSRDGAFVVYIGPSTASGTGFALWLRRWEDLDASPIPGARGGRQPAISPDGRQLAFQGRGRFITVLTFESGATQALLEGDWPRWGPDGLLYFSVGDGVVRMHPDGGQPERVLDLAEGELSIVVGDFLLDGTVLAHVTMAEGSAPQIRAVQLPSGETTVLEAGTWPRYTGLNYLTFISGDNSLMAAPFDPTTLEVGLVSRIVEDVAQHAISESGDLFYATVYPEEAVDNTELVWVTRSGEVTPVEQGWQFDLGGVEFGWRLSPDGTRIAFGRRTGINMDVWVKDVASRGLTRLTREPGSEWAPWWSPDGEHVAYFAGPENNVWSRRADGTGEATALWEVGGFAQGLWSPDEEWLILRTSAGSAFGAQGLRAIVAVRPGMDTAAVTLMATEFAEQSPALSPDGRALAYVSDETGNEEVYIRPFPEVDAGKITVSTGGGEAPWWGRDGEELFFLRGDTMVATRVETEPGLRVLGQEALFEMPGDLWSEGATTWMRANNIYDVAPDGRFLMGRRVPIPEGEVEATYILVQNWFEELKERMGGN